MHRNSCPETYGFPATNKIPSHHMLNSPISAAYSTLFSFWVHLQEGLDVMTIDVSTYTILKYHLKSEKRRRADAGHGCGGCWSARYW